MQEQEQNPNPNTLQIPSEKFVKIAKFLVGFCKDETILVRIHLAYNHITIQGRNVWFCIEVNLDGEFFYCFELPVVDLQNIAKLTKKNQGQFVNLDLENNKLVLESGISFVIHPDINNPSADSHSHLPHENLVYIDSTKVAAISKTIQRQKDYLGLRVYDCGVLVVGERQLSLIPFFSFEPAYAITETNPPALKFSNTQLNNLAKIDSSSELGFFTENTSIWGSDSFSIRWKEPEQNKPAPNLYLSHFLELKQKINEQSEDAFKLSNCKELEKLISTSKLADAYDLCGLELAKDKVNIHFYQNKELRNSLSFTDENLQLPDYEVEFYLQTKHLLSVIQFAKDYTVAKFVQDESLPLLFVSDLEIESLIMRSLVV